MNLRATLPLACTLALLMPASLPAADAAATPPPRPKIGSTVFAWDQMTAKPTPKGEVRSVANNPTDTLTVFECHITTLNPGQASHAPHQHAQEELIIVKEGRLEVHIKGQTQEAGAGSVFFYASNDAHAVRNIGSTRATYWVVNLATPATHHPAAHNQAPTLPSGVFDWEKLVAVPTATGERRQVLKGSTVTMESLTCHVTTLKPREAAHGAHRHPDDEVVLVKEGTMEATINGRAQTGGPGSVFLFTSNDLHGMRNVSDTRASYYVIRMITSATPKVAAK